MSQRTVWDGSPVGHGAASLAGIWGAVVAISLFAPDLVSGSEHEHLPIAAFTTWIWGAIASRRVITTLLRLDEAGSQTQLARQLAALVAGVWVVAAAVAIFAPQMVTGSDPTRLPIAAMLAPIAAAALTTGACDMASALAAQRHPRPFSTPDCPTHP